MAQKQYDFIAGAKGGIYMADGGKRSDTFMRRGESVEVWKEASVFFSYDSQSVEIRYINSIQENEPIFQS